MGLGFAPASVCHLDARDRQGLRWKRFAVKSFVIISFLVFMCISRGFGSWLSAASAQSSTASPVGSSAAGFSASRNNSLHSFGQRQLLEEAAGEPPNEENCKDCKKVEFQVEKTCAATFTLPVREQCQHARTYCHDTSTIFDSTQMHFCLLRGQAWVSVPLCILGVLASFYLLAETAEEYFCPVVARMSSMLGLPPNTAGVTLLAFGNGAPDVFASVAAFVGDNPKIGFGAIVSAGIFVTAFVVGCVSFAAAPFPVKGVAFTRDILFYVVAAAGVFAVYLSGEVHLWQASCFVLYYVVFVVFVVVADLRIIAVNLARARDRTGHHDEAAKLQVTRGYLSPPRPKTTLPQVDKLLLDEGVESLGPFRKVLHYIHLPFDIARKATIPAVGDVPNHRLWMAINIALCPVVFLLMFSAIVPINRHFVFFVPTVGVPIWLLVVTKSSLLGLAYFAAQRGEVSENVRQAAVFVSFATSVFWISAIAKELLGFLATLGLVIGLSPGILGLTVLAWGNSVGDLVADVAIARNGQPAMAVAGCFAGPMFNMLVGMGSALVLASARSHPAPYSLEFSANIPVAFGALFTSLLGSLAVVGWGGFQLTKAWGAFLIMLYIGFMAVSVLMEMGFINFSSS